MLPHLHNRIELHHSMVISLVIKTHGEGKLVIIHGGECVSGTNQRIPDTHSPPFSDCLCFLQIGIMVSTHMAISLVHLQTSYRLFPHLHNRIELHH